MLLGGEKRETECCSCNTWKKAGESFVVALNSTYYVSSPRPVSHIVTSSQFCPFSWVLFGRWTFQLLLLSFFSRAVTGRHPLPHTHAYPAGERGRISCSTTTWRRKKAGIVEEEEACKTMLVATDFLPSSSPESGEECPFACLEHTWILPKYFYFWK